LVRLGRITIMTNSKQIVRKKGKIEATVNFPLLKLTMESDDPVQSLRELNKVIHSMKTFELSKELPEIEEEPMFWRLGYLSEEIRGETEIMDFLKAAMKVEEAIKARKISVENTKVFDFDSQQYSSSLNVQKLKPKITYLCNGFERASYAVLHISGSISKDEKEAIVDLIKNRLQGAEIRTIFTNKELLGKTVIESVFCGSFEAEDDY